MNIRKAFQFVLQKTLHHVKKFENKRRYKRRQFKKEKNIEMGTNNILMFEP